MAKSNKSSKESPTISINTSKYVSNYIWVAGLLIFTFLLYANTLGHGFVLDDPLSLALNTNVTAGISGIGDIITGSYRENNFGGQLYRPISLIQFAIEWQITPNSPFIHHFFNVVWYSLTIGLIFLVVTNWFPNKSILISIFTALLFAAHPIHTEVIANIKSRDEIMSLFFILVALLSWHQFIKNGKLMWQVIAVSLYFLALLSKESAITMFPIFGLLAWYIYAKDVKFSFAKGVIFLIPVIVLLIIRQSLFGDMEVPKVDMMDNPIVLADGFAQRLSTSMVILLKYFKLLVYPNPLSSDYSYRVIPMADFGNIAVWISLLIHLGAVVFAVLNIKKRNFLSLSILGYLMAISLFSQIPIVIGTMFGERLVYLASFWSIVGFIFLLSQYFKDGENIWKANKVLIAAMTVILFLFSVLTFNRSAAWVNNLTLFTTDAATYPQSVRLNNGAAEEVLKTVDLILDETERNQIFAQAEAFCHQIMKVKPVPTAFLTLGNIRLKQKRYDEAIQYYDQVNDLQSIVSANKALAFRELGRNAGEKEQNIEKSQELLKKSLGLNDKDAETWFLIGVSHGISGNHLLAAEHFENAYKLNPTPDYAKNVIMAYQNLGNQNKVEQYQLLLREK